MKLFSTILSLSGIGIGSYMVFTYANAALPPTLSGIAFISLGLSQLLSNK